MNSPLLIANSVSKSFQIGNRSLAILKDISLQVAPGEFIAILGASGAGKSTLLNLLGGLDLPDSGTVVFDAQQTDKLSDAALTKVRNKKIGFVFQSYHLLPELDALENVTIPARIARVPLRQAEEKAMHLLNLVGLKDRLEHRPAELSGGEQQRVAIARACMNDPILLIADEPTGNLDSKTGSEILDILLKMRAERACTLILATHDPKIAVLADRSFYIKDGFLQNPE